MLCWSMSGEISAELIDSCIIEDQLSLTLSNYLSPGRDKPGRFRPIVAVIAAVAAAGVK